MARARVTAFSLIVLASAVPTAFAQGDFTGLLTGHLGAAHDGDIRGGGLTPGVSVAVLDARGFGAELDLAHTREFDDERFDESGVTSLMLNVVGMYPHPTLRPFVNVGAGVIRVRASPADGMQVASRTDAGFSAGGGLLLMLTDYLGVRGDLRYFRYFQRHDDVPLLDNGFFDFWRSSVGVTYSWPIR